MLRDPKPTATTKALSTIIEGPHDVTAEATNALAAATTSAAQTAIAE
jgi:hypothetical protein